VSPPASAVLAADSRFIARAASATGASSTTQARPSAT
jgi:hypothetical protein